MFCRFYQTAIQNDLDDFGSIRRPALIHHLQKCSRCRAFYHQIKGLETQLRTSTSGDVTDGQVEKIRSAVRQRLTENIPTQSTVSGIRPYVYFHLRYGITAAAAMLLISLVGIYYFNQTRPAPTADPMAQFVTQTAVVQNRISLLTRLPEKSIRAEMQKLTGDVRTAVDFLTDCIPSNPADTQPKPEENQ